MLDNDLKKIADKMMKSPNRVIGVVFDQHRQYIEGQEGKEGIKKIEQKMAELGYGIKFTEMKSFEYYPVGLSDLVIVVAKEVFGWTKEDIFEMGNQAPKFSILVKTFLKYFVSLERSVAEASNYWKKHFTKGKLEYELHQDQKYVIIRLKHEITHPLLCVFLAGYFLRIAQYVIKSDKIDIEETKCAFRGDSFHEYKIKWK